MSIIYPPDGPVSQRRHATFTGLAWVVAGLALIVALVYGAPPLLDRFARTDQPDILVSLVAGAAVATSDAGALMVLLVGLRRLSRALSKSAHVG